MRNENFFKKSIPTAFVLVLFISVACHAGSNVLKPAILPSPRTFNPMHMVVIFSKFKGEAPDDSLASGWVSKLFEPDRPGSVPHYCAAVSFDQIKVTGEYLPKMYELPWNSEYYVNGLYKYVRDLIDLVAKDPTVDLSLYDNDGPDGKPSTDDDDGYVDYLVLMPISHEYDFILKKADGKARLEIDSPIVLFNYGFKKRTLRIDQYSGSIATGWNLNQAAGLICEEYLQGFGTPDLHDPNYNDGKTDSAGVGWWSLMGWGIIGWYGDGRTCSPCAHTRMLLGCIGIRNENLVDLYGVHKNIVVPDVATLNGKVYRIWVSETEYFLIENRRNDGFYYDRDIPTSGLLIWHVNENSYNDYEENKRVDLECADGKYLDAGYPLGKQPDPDNGGDNLDFWAHDSEYAKKHEGNLGDATDVYDGIRFTRFGPDTNPNSGTASAHTYTGIDIFNIRPDGRDMIFDVVAPPLRDWSKEKIPLIGTALHRTTFDNSYGDDHDGESASKATASYIISYRSYSAGDALITVYNDSMVIDTLAGLSVPETQRIIEHRLLSISTVNSSIEIVRENISPETFQSTLVNNGFSLRDFGENVTIRWVQKISAGGSIHSQPSPIKLDQNYPNPFNATTSVTYYLPADDTITFEVYNLIGQKVLSIDRGYERAGNHSISFTADNLSSGVYLYRIKGVSHSSTRKCVLIR